MASFIYQKVFEAYDIVKVPVLHPFYEKYSVLFMPNFQLCLHNAVVPAFSHWWTFGLFPPSGYCEQCCFEHRFVCVPGSGTAGFCGGSVFKVWRAAKQHLNPACVPAGSVSEFWFLHCFPAALFMHLFLLSLSYRMWSGFELHFLTGHMEHPFILLAICVSLRNVCSSPLLILKLLSLPFYCGSIKYFI